jgi:hypothetical protein
MKNWYKKAIALNPEYDPKEPIQLQKILYQTKAIIEQDYINKYIQNEIEAIISQFENQQNIPNIHFIKNTIIDRIISKQFQENIIQYILNTIEKNLNSNLNELITKEHKNSIINELKNIIQNEITNIAQQIQNNKYSYKNNKFNKIAQNVSEELGQTLKNNNLMPMDETIIEFKNMTQPINQIIAQLQNSQNLDQQKLQNFYQNLLQNFDPIFNTIQKIWNQLNLPMYKSLTGNYRSAIIEIDTLWNLTQQIQNNIEEFLPPNQLLQDIQQALQHINNSINFIQQGKKEMWNITNQI